MARFKIAHIREQGIDLIIVPLDSSFGNRTTDDQHSFIRALQACASSAGIAGTVVPVWVSGSTRSWICPPNWNSFFQSCQWNDILANLNKELTCG